MLLTEAGHCRIVVGGNSGIGLCGICWSDMPMCKWILQGQLLCERIRFAHWVVPVSEGKPAKIVATLVVISSRSG